MCEAVMHHIAEDHLKIKELIRLDFCSTLTWSKIHQGGNKQPNCTVRLCMCAHPSEWRRLFRWGWRFHIPALLLISSNIWPLPSVRFPNPPSALLYCCVQGYLLFQAHVSATFASSFFPLLHNELQLNSSSEMWATHLSSRTTGWRRVLLFCFVY